MHIYFIVKINSVSYCSKKKKIMLHLISAGHLHSCIVHPLGCFRRPRWASQNSPRLNQKQGQQRPQQSQLPRQPAPYSRREVEQNTALSVLSLLDLPLTLSASSSVRSNSSAHRVTQDRSFHGSMNRLDHPLSTHSSLHRIDNHSRHSSQRDVSEVPPTLITHGTSASESQVAENGGTSAWDQKCFTGSDSKKAVDAERFHLLKLYVPWVTVRHRSGRVWKN